jgi:hypothetical protein
MQILFSAAAAIIRFFHPCTDPIFLKKAMKGEKV